MNMMADVGQKETIIWNKNWDPTLHMAVDGDQCTSLVSPLFL
jgi:hypothetical protein